MADLSVIHDAIIESMADLSTDLVLTWTKSMPVLDKLLTKKHRKRAKGDHIEFVLTPSGPGQANAVRSGTEIINAGRVQDKVRASEYAGYAIYAYDLTNKEVKIAHNADGVADLVKGYGIAAFEHLAFGFAKEFVMGGVEGMDVFLTLNGERTYFTEKGQTPRPGVFEFAPAASQSQVLHEVAKNSIVGWYHQYDHINSFEDEGIAKIRRLYAETSKEGRMMSGKVDVLLADTESYNNYLTALDDKLVLTSIIKGDGGPTNVRDGIPFGNSGAMMYDESMIDLSGFSTPAAQRGVIYMLNTSTWNLFNNGDGIPGTELGASRDGLFFARKNVKHLPTQDMARFEYEMNLGMYTTNLRANGVITGGMN